MTNDQTSNARDNRKLKTVSEGLLWSILRAHQLCGLKFRREHPIGGFIADFACEAKKLVIEIDGGYHDQTTAQDIEREKTLRSLGWDVIRFTDKEVEQDAESAARAIARHLQLDYSLSKRHGGSSGMKAQARSQHQASSEPADDSGPSPKPRSSASTLPRGG
jgi:very-short-patch-repair endonuclease